MSTRSAEPSIPVHIHPERWYAAVQRAWRAAGFRMTEPRSRVLRQIASYTMPFSAEQVYAELQQDDFSPGRATVYRALEQLSSEGWVVRIYTGNSDSSYVPSWPGHIHHLVCRSCGKVIAFEGCGVGALLASLSEQTDFVVEGHMLEVYGLCADCRQQSGV